ncbi:unnamed protein product [Linum trigynum]|uniref:DUF1995 domain-containing protein n=1 Tax=Linum trigynum TaxID=586398 RepID=A0AAV2EG80_9ROSI
MGYSSLLKLHSQIFNPTQLSPPPLLYRHPVLSQSLPFTLTHRNNDLHHLSITHSVLPKKRSKLCCLQVHSSLPSSSNPPASREEAILQAQTCLSKTLEKPLNNPKLVGRIKKLKQPRFQVEIPVVDDSPASLSQLALEIFKDLPIKRKGSPVKTLILWPNPALRDAAIEAFQLYASPSSSANVEHVDMSSYDNIRRSISGADVAVFLSPESSQLVDVKRVADGMYPNPVVILNPRWGLEEEGGERDGDFGEELSGFVGSFEVIYSFMGLEVQGVLSKRKGVIFKCVRDGIVSGEKWSVLVEEEGGEMKVISQFKARPSIGEVEIVLYNLMAINSPITKSAKFLKDLVSNVTGRK